MTPAATQPIPGIIARDGDADTLPLAVRLGIGLLVLWTITQAVAMIASFPIGIRKFIIPIKVLIGPMTFALIIVLTRPDMRGQRALRGFFWFALFSAMNLILRSEPNWPRAALFIAWGSCFVVIPSVLDTAQRIRIFVRLSLWGILGSILLAMVMAVMDDNYFFTGHDRTRFHFGMNPNYFAMLTAMLTGAGLTAWALEPDRNPKFYWLTIIFGCVLTVMTDCRAQVLMIATMLIVYGTHTRGVIRYVSRTSVALLITGAIVTVPLVGTQVLPMETLDQFSSGRFTIWSHVLEANIEGDDPVALLWGSGQMKVDNRLMPGMRLEEDDPLTRGDRANAIFSRKSCDNSYLDILFTTGLIGLLLGIYAWSRWWTWLSAQRVDTEERRVYVAITKALIAATLISSFFASRWPAMGSLVVTYGLVLCIGMTTALNKQRNAAIKAPLEGNPKEWNPPGRIR